MRSPDANLFPSMTRALLQDVWLATLPVKPAALVRWAVRGIVDGAVREIVDEAVRWNVLQTVYRKGGSS